MRSQGKQQQAAPLPVPSLAGCAPHCLPHQWRNWAQMSNKGESFDSTHLNIRGNRLGVLGPQQPGHMVFVSRVRTVPP